jgi:hypothetical protein
MTKVSIIIPSLRKDRLMECMVNVLAHSKGVDYEMVIISPFTPPFFWDGKVVWVNEEKAEGVMHAVESGVQKATGEYITTVTDEAIVQYAWLDNMLRFMEGKKGVLGSFKVIPPYPFYYYGRYFAPFPFIHRDLLRRVGMFYDTKYKAFYADPDLSMRVWDVGGTVEECPDALIESKYYNDGVHSNNVNKYHAKDKETFINTWSKWGEFVECP